MQQQESQLKLLLRLHTIASQQARLDWADDDDDDDDDNSGDDEYYDDDDVVHVDD